MSIKKILLKTQSGQPAASATVYTGEAQTVKLPAGLTMLAAAKGTLIAITKKTNEGYVIDSDGAPLSLLCKKGTETLFGTESQGADTTFIKWLLQNETEEKSDTPSKHSHEEPPAELRSESAAQETEPIPEPQETLHPEKHLGEGRRLALSEAQTPAVEIYETDDADAPVENGESSPDDTPDLSAEKELSEKMKTGEPFPLFGSLIPNSEWVIIKEDGSLIGRVREGDEEIFLLGLPGRLGEAPDDNAEWTFIPTDEEEDDGYYVKRAI